ncbi:MAG: hypothetical protein M1820_000539 [Bogoriella megaspora]|nr:MAG: hypothetical protein M1820_000539 [Bogoriella megaspora]
MHISSHNPPVSPFMKHKRQPQAWLSSKSSAQPFLSNDKIPRQYLLVNSPLFTTPSESPLADPLNSRIASRDTFSSPQTTFNTFDFTSFTTAQPQQTWLSPAASAPRHTPQPTFSNQPDFVLFDQPAAHSQASHPSPATNRRHTFNNVQTQFLSNSPSTSAAQVHQRNNSQVHRPPVPLFSSNSAPNVVQQSPTMFDGNSAPNISVASSRLTPLLDMSNNLAAGLDGWTDGNTVTDMDISAPLTNFTSINSNDNQFTQSMSTGTISPKDLVNESVPNSTALTNLTSPSPWETPLDDFETSPLFDSGNTDATLGGADHWFSLFPNEEQDDVIQRSTSQRSFDSTASASPIVLHPGGLSNRKMSTTASPSVKQSQIAGVHKKNRELPPITANPDDPVAVKRARNTAAARKSRDRKVKKFEDMEAEIMTLRAEKDQLQDELDEWKRRALAGGS